MHSNFCMALPGPEAQQLASYVGYSLYGVRGAITSGGLFVLPSFVLLCVMSGIYVEFGDVTVVEGAVSGLGAAVVALVTAAVIRVGSRVIHTPAALGLAAVAFLAIAVGVPFPVIIALAALPRGISPAAPTHACSVGPPDTAATRTMTTQQHSTSASACAAASQRAS